jgi:hypothetical protein
MARALKTLAIVLRHAITEKDLETIRCTHYREMIGLRRTRRGLQRLWSALLGEKKMPG